MSSKHLKQPRPTDADLKGNPMINGNKGTTLAGATADDVEDALADTTIEGDVANDTNQQGGISKSVARGTKSPVR